MANRSVFFLAALAVLTVSGQADANASLQGRLIGGASQTGTVVVAKGQPVLLRFEITNRGNKTIRLRTLPFWVGHRLDVSVDRRLGSAQRTRVGKQAALQYDPAARGPWTTHTMRPGIRVVLQRFNLAHHIDISLPGRYSLRIWHKGRVRMRSQLLHVWVVMPRVHAQLRHLRSAPLDAIALARTRRALKKYGLRLHWDAVSRSYRLVEKGTGTSQPIAARDQKCRSSHQCVRVSMRCCCPQKAVAINRRSLKRVRARWSKACRRMSCPAVVCRRPGPNLHASCQRGWCVPR